MRGKLKPSAEYLVVSWESKQDNAMYCIKGRHPGCNRNGTATRTAEIKPRIPARHFTGGKSKKQNEAINVSRCGQKLHIVGMKVRKANRYPLIQEELNNNMNLTSMG